MKRVAKRSSADKEWQEVKEKVRLRDKNQCRLMRVLTVPEYYLLRKNGAGFLNTIDPAHIIPVSAAPELTYNEDDIVCLNHFSHSNLDSYRDPIDGHSISKEEVNKWWIRILKGNREQYDNLMRDYSFKLIDEVEEN